MRKYTIVYLKKLVSDINLKRGYGPNPVYSTIGAIDLVLTRAMKLKYG